MLNRFKLPSENISQFSCSLRSLGHVLVVGVFLYSAPVFAGNKSLLQNTAKYVWTMRSGNSLGTIFQIEYKNKRLLITNSHVCRGDKLKVYWRERESSPFTLILRWNWKDLCAGTAPNMPSGGLTLAKKSPPVYTELFSMGFPKGIWMATRGVLIKRIHNWEDPIPMADECKKQGRFIFDKAKCKKLILSVSTSLFAKGGSSGSPVLIESGQVIGVIKQRWTALDKAILVDYKDLKDFLNVATGN